MFCVCVGVGMFVCLCVGTMKLLSDWMEHKGSARLMRSG